MTHRIVLLAALAACGGRAATPAIVDNTAPAPTGDGDAAFQGLAREVATHLDARVADWGTAPIADDGAPRRVAVLRSNGAGNERGGYLIESAAGQIYLVSFVDDGRTSTWGDEATGDAAPAWHASPDTRLWHQAGHARGFERVELAVRAGVPVGLSHTYLADAREGDDERHEDLCAAGACPVLSTLETDAQIVVTGPAATADALVETLPKR